LGCIIEVVETDGSYDLRQASEDLAFVLGELDPEETAHYWELLESGRFTDAIREVERVATSAALEAHSGLS